jgi:hypothetical protein
MLRKLLIAAAGFASIAVAGALPIAPAEAQSVCLRNNRIYGWDAINDNTLIVSDRQRNRYMVHLNGGCLGLRENLFTVAFRTTTSLGCLRRGDRVSFRSPTFGPETCFVRDIELIEVNPRSYSRGYRYGDRWRDDWRFRY